MASTNSLIKKREELKRQIVAGEHKTLVDAFLEWFERLIRKITRRTKPLPIWYITTILSTIIILASLVSIGTTDNLITLYRLSDLWELKVEYVVLWLISNTLIFVISSILINRYIRRIFLLWHDDLLDATDSVESLEQFEYWYQQVCNRPLHFLTAIAGGLLAFLVFVIPLSKALGAFVGYGFTFATVIINIFGWSFLYQFFVSALLPVRLHRYNLNLFPADPASSELISRLSGEFSYAIYIVAIFAAVVTVTTTFAGLLPSFGFLIVIIYWIPIVTMFILNQTSLSSMIRRVKWKTLSEIQAKVEKLQTSKNFGNQETMDSIKRLMDYHDRVKATRDSALDFRTYLSFINSLLLPLLAFILSNLDLIFNLFSKNP